MAIGILGGEEHGRPPSTGEPELLDLFGTSDVPEAPAADSTTKLPFIAAIIGALVLLGGGSFFALTALGQAGGAETPEAAVDQLLEAASNEDFITIGLLIEPSERRTVIQPTVTEIMPELVRLGVFERAPNPGKVEGLDIEFTNATYRIEPQLGNADIVHVVFTGGQMATEFDASKLPFTDAYRNEFADDLSDPEREVEDLANESAPMVLVQRNGRWYVSGWFTLAENIRLDDGELLPTEAESPPTLGSSSPELAVENMLDEMMTLDVAGMIGRTDPDEMAALYRYSPLFLDEAQEEADQALDEMAAEGYRWNLSNLDINAEESGDDAKVLVRGYNLDVQGPDLDFSLAYGPESVSGNYISTDTSVSFDLTQDRWLVEGNDNGETVFLQATITGPSVVGTANLEGSNYEFTVTIDPNGDCSTATIVENGETTTIECLEDEAGGQLNWYSASFSEWTQEFPAIPFAARRTEGEWYVSPVGSVFDVYINSLARIDDDAFKDMDSAGESLFLLSPVSGLLFYGFWYL